MTATCTAKNPSSTSYKNNFYANVLGVAPNGARKPNGVDFWWDEFPSNTGDCWHDNKGPGGSNTTWTGDPARFPSAGMSVPHFLPEACGAPGDVGTGNAEKEAVLAYCAEAAIGDPSCEWYVEPSKPSPSSATGSGSRRGDRAARRLLARMQLTGPRCALRGDTLSCALFANRP